MGTEKTTSKPDFDEFLPNVEQGRFTCPICHEFTSDSVRGVKGHISGKRDEQHKDLGWNYESEIRATAEDK